MYKSLPLLPLHRSLRHNLNRLWRGRRHRYSTERSDELSADCHAGRGGGRRINRQLGMTLLEVMIVMAILALIMGLVVGPRVMAMFDRSKINIAQSTVKKLAFEEFAMWSQANPDKSCPGGIEELVALSNSKKIHDPWQEQYRLMCGPTLPPGVIGVAVASNGPDQKEGTNDDIRSWD